MPLARLSGGQRRLIEVYVSIKSNAVFSILDEPFTLLMPIHIERIKKILMHEKAKKGYLITDHLYKEVVDIADYVYILKSGGTYLTKSGYV